MGKDKGGNLSPHFFNYAKKSEQKISANSEADFLHLNFLGI
jgi:hypothetical protein